MSARTDCLNRLFTPYRRKGLEQNPIVDQVVDEQKLAILETLVDEINSLIAPFMNSTPPAGLAKKIIGVIAESLDELDALNEPEPEVITRAQRRQPRATRSNQGRRKSGRYELGVKVRS